MLQQCAVQPPPTVYPKNNPPENRDLFLPPRRRRCGGGGVGAGVGWCLCCVGRGHLRQLQLQRTARVTLFSTNGHFGCESRTQCSECTEFIPPLLAGGIALSIALRATVVGTRHVALAETRRKLGVTLFTFTEMENENEKLMSSRRVF